jgi:Na+-transporting NADH:ubiquinone oxidoreductase subunit B
MKAIQNLMDSLRPQFEPGGKYHKFWPAYDAFYTFLFVPGHTTPVRGAHIRDGIDLKRTMFTVIIALIPALLFGMYNAGYQHFKAADMLQTVTFWDMFLYGAGKIIPMLIVSYGVGLGIEFGMAVARGHQVNEGYLVTGMLIPLIMPIDLPLWMLAISVVFAVVIGKEVFGGTGMNILNPALTARVFAFFAYPSYMSGDKVWIGGMLRGEAVDGYSGATALGDLATTGTTQFSVMDMFIGFIPGSVGETSTLAILIGAAILLITGVGSWKIMLSGVIGALFMGILLNGISGYATTPEMQGFLSVPAWQHLIMGGFAFGIVFMATDPVSAAQTEKGKWIYGFLVGFFAILIRVLNPAYPEGIMLAILLMNVFAPLIDHYVVEANIRKRMKRMKLQTVKA